MEPSCARKQKGERAQKIIERLEKAYPNAKCELDFQNPFQLLIATILSAQCTDKRVNMVTKHLFKKYKTPKDFCQADLQELEKEVYTTGFYRNKAKNIKAASQMLTEAYSGRVPGSMEELIKLPGVARKTANVILGSGFGVTSGVVVDTHVQRVARRLGLSRGKDPVKVERDLMRILPKEKWIAVSHALVFHGRYVCVARNPKCYQCVVYDLCRSKDKILVIWPRR